MNNVQGIWKVKYQSGDTLTLIVFNIVFVKKESRLLTYESSEVKSYIDFFLCTCDK